MQQFNQVRPDGGYRSSVYSENTESKNKSLTEKKQKLFKEVEQYTTHDSEMIEKDEVKSILDQRLRHTGKVFDDELVDAIFNNLDRDLNGRITKHEFCDGYIDVENFFCENIST
jgi:Ca2+-binding EF-hand superfamily protein